MREGMIIDEATIQFASINYPSLRCKIFDNTSGQLLHNTILNNCVEFRFTPCQDLQQLFIELWQNGLMLQRHRFSQTDFYGFGKLGYSNGRRGNLFKMKKQTEQLSIYFTVFCLDGSGEEYRHLEELYRQIATENLKKMVKASIRKIQNEPTSIKISGLDKKRGSMLPKFQSHKLNCLKSFDNNRQRLSQKGLQNAKRESSLGKANQLSESSFPEKKNSLINIASAKENFGDASPHKNNFNSRQVKTSKRVSRPSCLGKIGSSVWKRGSQERISSIIGTMISIGSGQELIKFDGFIRKNSNNSRNEGKKEGVARKPKCSILNQKNKENEES